MKKEVPQDVVPPQRRSIRNIPIPDGRRRPAARGEHTPVSAPVHDEIISHEPETLTIRPHASAKETRRELEGEPEEINVRRSFSPREEEEEPQEQASTPTRRVVSFDDDSYAPRRGKKILILSSVVGVAFLAVIIMFFTFGGATITVYPKQVTTTLNTEITAVNVTSADQEGAAVLSFAASELVAQSTRKVEATGEEEVVEKAKGTITIYNEYTEEDQRLVKNTRFASPDGLIFRIPDSVVVPGTTRDGSGNVVPGKLTTEVIADVAGKEYNISAGRFTVPGFEGLPQYDGFYAISQNAMQGGFDGVKKIVSDEDRNKAERELREEIKADLIAQAESQSTEEIMTFVDESLTLYENLNEEVDGDTVTIGMKGTTNAIAVETRALAHAAALGELNSFNEEDVVLIDNLDTLRLRAFATTGDENLTTVRIAVEGDAKFEWQLDEAAFKTFLAGKDKDMLSSAVGQFASITKADGKIRPIWKSAFPTNTEKISIVYVKE